MQHFEPNDWKKYIITFLVTGALFLSAFWVSNYFTGRKIDQVKIAEDKISLDLMSSEIQFSLLQEMSCKDVSTNALSSELNSLAEKISYSESNIGTENSNVVSLKKYYSILEIKDYLLMKRITERCGQKSVFVLYFYDNDTCADCTKQGYVLTSLKEKYPALRVYSFDYNLDLSAIKAMISIYNVPDKMPALVINGKVYSGFQSIETVEKNFPQLKTLKKKEIPESKETTKKSA
ncbi:MAG: hypothetical protein WC059_00565 [Candidatus Paceibacterota bacterium]